mmetsp:Transcript_20388/g.33951  ORF Transcript_20388/g.33951 Transcript_20388/m.33951 type:complete len:479 (+) Transcript_20388:132-1568(+)
MSPILAICLLFPLLNSAGTAYCELSVENGCAVERESAKQSLFLMQTVARLRLPKPNTLERAIADRVLHKTVIPRETSGNSSGKTAPPDNSTQEEHTTFAHAKYVKNGEKELEVSVKIARPKDILKIFVCIYLPLSSAWIYYYSTGRYDEGGNRLFLLLLQITVASFTLGTVLVNQSLSVLMKSPMILTAMQSFSMLIFGIVITGLHYVNHTRPLLEVLGGELLTWLPAAAAFGVYQLADHLEANYCSLSERTVFGNLAPVVGLSLEVAMKPCLKHRGSEAAFTSLASKAALGLKVFGAAIFALQYPDFNTVGMEVSSLFVFTMVGYRLTQRFLLDRLSESPVALLTMVDAIISLVISGGLSFVEVEDMHQTVHLWLNDPSIFIMLLLSFATFSLGHWTTLQLVKADTATATMVIGNISSGFSVIQGIFFFNDSDFQRPLAFVGILLVICGGIWWTINQSLARYEKQEEACPEAGPETT